MRKFICSTLSLCLALTLFQTVFAQSPQVTIDRKPGQPNPSTSPVVFSVVFSAPINVATFTADKIVLTGTAPGKAISNITQVSPNDGTTFEVTATATSNTGTIIATMPAAYYSSAIFASAGTNPTGLLQDATGNIYVSNWTDFTVSKITPAGVSSILGTTGGYPGSIVEDAAGNIYTINDGNNFNITKITPAGVSTVFASTNFYFPTNGIIDATGNIYVPNLGSGTIAKITPAGVSTIFATGNSGSGPNKLYLDAAGNIFVANIYDNNVAKITPAGVYTVLASTGSGPGALVQDAAGNTYTANSNSNDISKITPAGVSTIFATTGTNPYDIVIDPAGNLYTNNYKSNNVSKITPAGVSSIIATTGTSPARMIIDASGDLYTTNYGSNNVTKITLIGIALANSTMPTNLASTSTNNTFILPVTLVNFTVTSKECSATLAWETASEMNSSAYIIESSSNGLDFTNAATVPSKNNITGAYYTYTFSSLTKGTTFYRLKMVDIDGHYTYSKFLSANSTGNCIATSLQFKVYPNPAKDYIILDGVNNGSAISILNSIGARLTLIIATSNNQRINISQYPAGVYEILVVAANGTTQTVKLLKN